MCAGGATFLLCLELAGVGVVCAGCATFLLCLELAGVVAVWFVGWTSSCFLRLCLEPAGVVAVCLVGLRGPFLLCIELVGVGVVCRWCQLFLSRTLHACIKIVRICPYN